MALSLISPNIPDIESYNKHIRICGVLLAIIAIDSSLAIMNGADELVSPFVYSIRALPNYVATVLLIYLIASRQKYHRLYFPLFIAWLLDWLLNTFHVVSGYDASITWLALAVLAVTCANEKRIWFYAYFVFRKYLIFISFFGIIGYVMFLSGAIPPLKIAPYYGNWLDASYIVYPFTYIVASLGSIRLCGLFHEPADLGMFTIFVLIAERFNLKKRGNILLLLAGILSFSFGFFAIMLVYFGFRVLNNPRKMSIFLFSTLLIGFVVIPLIPKNSMFGELIGRFSYDKSEGRLSGYNRENDAFEARWESAERSGDLIFGLGEGYKSETDRDVTASYKSTIIKHGYVGAFLVWILLLIAAIRYLPLEKETMIFIFCVFLSIVYSPGILKVGKMICLFGGLLNLKYLIQSDIGVQKKLVRSSLHTSNKVN